MKTPDIDPKVIKKDEYGNLMVPTDRLTPNPKPIKPKGDYNND